VNTLSEKLSSGNRANPGKGILIRFAQIAIFLLLQAILLFGAAGRIDWLWAWVFLGICVASVGVNGAILLRTSPETIAERGLAKETKMWDKILSGLWTLALMIIVPLLSGLDVRYEWTGELSSSVNIAGAAVLSLGLGLGGWAMITNAYFSTAVRIQSDRGQTVCRTGPYRFVRHPGYVGFILQSFATPILLGSLWALVAGIAGALFIAIRTSFEDRMLQAELAGSSEFAREVRYRLIPGIW
jgi:protein-S-isoprenylcysteine O-methyltransferase Ste14